jgi:Glycosyl transferases group 1
MKNGKNLVVAIYSHPDYYPPTLNAIENLAGQYDSITVVPRNIIRPGWKYPGNVKLITPKRLFTVKELETAPTFKKIWWFLQFTRRFFSAVVRSKADTILIYDSIPVLSYRLINKFINKPKILWYHNHDVMEPQYIRKWSLSWLGWKSEKWIFQKLDLFSLPALERMVCFPMEKLHGKFFFLPNFPSLAFYDKYKTLQKDVSGNIRILFQGSIGPLHGIEEILEILPRKIEGKNPELWLKGFIGEAYKNELMCLAAQFGVKERLIFIPPTSYSKVVENAQNCHIGIGIHKKQDMMNKTLGTSSNKIYEYAASGLPVLLYDNPHFRGHLGQYNWAFFTDCSKTSLIASLEKIMTDYGYLSDQARQDFANKLNFEKYFEPVVNHIQSIHRIV